MHPDQLTIEALQPWLEVRFSRSDGPGGQNVNKLSTRVTLVFNFQACSLLTPPQKARIDHRSSSRLTKEGYLYIVAREDRSQSANRAKAEIRLLQWLREVLAVRKIRRPTQPSQGSQIRRLQTKKRRGQTKRLRGERPVND